MTGLAKHHRKPFAMNPIHWRWRTRIGVLGALPFLVVGLWVAWSFVWPNPAGFAPTAGTADRLMDTPALHQFTVDARSRRDWVFFDFATGGTVATTQDGLDWDIAFRRTDVLTNGGATNPAGHAGAIDLGTVPLDEAVVPDGPFVADLEHDERGIENPELHRWYSYNWTTHIVSSRNHTYAIRTSGGGVVLVTFVSYYCADGPSGCVTFQYRPAAGAEAGMASQ